MGPMNSFYVMQDLVHLHVPYGQTDGGVFVMQVDVARAAGRRRFTPTMLTSSSGR